VLRIPDVSDHNPWLLISPATQSSSHRAVGVRYGTGLLARLPQHPLVSSLCYQFVKRNSQACPAVAMLIPPGGESLV